jgi:transposase-like protein
MGILKKLEQIHKNMDNVIVSTIKKNNLVPMYKFRQIASECQIKKLVRKVLFGTHVHCPRCKSRRVQKSENRYRCRDCRRPFSLTSNTWLSNMKISWEKFYLILWCWLNHIPITQTMKMTELSEVSIREWFDKLRVNVPDPGWMKPLMGKVQMDEAFFKKAAVIAAKDVERKRVILRVVNHTNLGKNNASQFIVRHVEPGSKLFTDGGGIYSKIEQIWPVEHERDIHSKWEFGKTSEIEGVFGNLRTFIRRKYHHVTCSKLAKIVAEFEANFNHPEMFQNPTIFLEKSLFLVPTC